MFHCPAVDDGGDLRIARLRCFGHHEDVVVHAVLLVIIIIIVLQGGEIPSVGRCPAPGARGGHTFLLAGGPIGIFADILWDRLGGRPGHAEWRPRVAKPAALPTRANSMLAGNPVALLRRGERYARRGSRSALHLSALANHGKAEGLVREDAQPRGLLLVHLAVVRRRLLLLRGRSVVADLVHASFAALAGVAGALVGPVSPTAAGPALDLFALALGLGAVLAALLAAVLATLLAALGLLVVPRRLLVPGTFSLALVPEDVQVGLRVGPVGLPIELPDVHGLGSLILPACGVGSHGRERPVPDDVLDMFQQVAEGLVLLADHPASPHGFGDEHLEPATFRGVIHRVEADLEGQQVGQPALQLQRHVEPCLHAVARARVLHDEPGLSLRHLEELAIDLAVHRLGKSLDVWLVTKIQHDVDGPLHARSLIKEVFSPRVHGARKVHELLAELCEGYRILLAGPLAGRQALGRGVVDLGLVITAVTTVARAFPHVRLDVGQGGRVGRHGALHQGHCLR
eukprot:7606636-Heterocapsa_arctica.AAC.2